MEAEVLNSPLRQTQKKVQDCHIKSVHTRLTLHQQYHRKEEIENENVVMTVQKISDFLPVSVLLHASPLWRLFSVICVIVNVGQCGDGL